MARDLGSASGRIEIEFDDSGTNEAQREFDEVGDSATRAAVKAILALKALEREASNVPTAIEGINGAFRSLDGRLRDARGRYIREGRASGDGFKSGFLGGLGGLQKGVAGVAGKLIGILGKIGKAAAGAAAISLLGVAAAQATVGIVGLIGSLAPLAGLIIALPAAIATGVAALLALKVALLGVSDAFSAALTGDAAAFDEALKKLSPSARAFMREIREIAPVLKAVQQQIQENLFEGMARHIQPLVDRYLPMLRGLGIGIAADFNYAAQKVALFFQRASALSDVANIFANIRATIHPLATALAPVVGALVDIVAVGSEQLPGIANVIASLAKEFARFISTARQSGQLDAFFQAALDTLRQLGGILHNVGSIFLSVFQASSGAGGGLLNTMLQLTTAVARFLRSAEGQQALASFFGALAQVTTALMPILLTLASAFANHVAPIMATLAGTIGPALNDALKNLSPALAALAPAAAPVAAAIAALLRALGPLLPVIGQVAAVILTQLANAIQTLLPVITPVIAVVGGALMAVFRALAPILLAVARAVLPLAQQFGGALAQALASVVPAVALLAVTFARSLAPQLPAIMKAFQQLMPFLVEAAKQFGGALTQALLSLAPHMPALARAAVQLAIAMIQVLVALGPILPPLAKLIGLAATSTQGIKVLTKILELGARQMQFTAAVIRTVINVLGAFRNAASSTSGAVSGAISNMIARFNGLRSGAANAIGSLMGVVRSIPGQIRSALGSLGSLLVSAGSDAIGGLVRGMAGAAGRAFAKAREIAGKIASTIKGALRIGSPAKVIIPLGEAIPEALIVGMDNLARDVARAALDLANIPPITFASPNAFVPPPSTVVPTSGAAAPVAATAVGSGGVGVIQNITQQPGESGEELAAKVNGYLAWKGTL